MTEKFKVTYTNRDIMDKLIDMHESIKVTNGTVKIHTKLIYGAFGFTFALLIAGLTILL